MTAFPHDSQNAPASLRQRLQTWWHGSDVPAKRAAPFNGLNAASQPKILTRELARVLLVQDLWGKGFSSPVDHDHLLEPFRRLNLSPAMNVMEIGAGLGGTSRALAEHFGIWVTAFEKDRMFAESGMELSSQSGMAKKAPVVAFDPENFETEELSYDCIYSNEFLFTVKKKNELLRALSDALKNGGQILFTDFVKAEEVGSGDALFEWIRSEPVTPQIWSLKDYDMALSRLKINVRAADDVTEAFRTQVITGWFDYLQTASREGVDKQIVEAVATEVELWARRIKTFDSGELRVVRILGQKEKTAMLSDW